MKKYIIGLVSAICLIGAGCTKFEDFTPSDLGEGPAVTATLTTPENTIGTLKATVTPAEGTVYYSYLLTTEALPKVDPMTLLQADYESTLAIAGLENAVLVNYADQKSVEFTLDNQELTVTYYLYAVASNSKGVCGDVAVAELLLPDTEAPHLVNIPSGDAPYKYRATNKGRSVVLEFNEAVTRGEGKITYLLANYDAETYADGVISDVAINNNMVTITLPEEAVLREQEVSYVFLGFEAGAFTDASGNKSVVMVAGIDEDGGISSPWWEYDPTNTGGGGNGETMVGTYGFLAAQYDFETQTPSESITAGFDTEFTLKYENLTDTVIINNFYFSDESVNKLEAGICEDGFTIADFQVMGLIQVSGYNCLCLFAGAANDENDNFTEVKFGRTETTNGIPAFLADRWCGLYLLDYDVLSAGGSVADADLGWGDLWNQSFFIEGSVNQSAAAQAALPEGVELLLKNQPIKTIRALQPAEVAKVQNQLKGFKVRALK